MKYLITIVNIKTGSSQFITRTEENIEKTLAKEGLSGDSQNITTYHHKGCTVSGLSKDGEKIYTIISFIDPLEQV